MNFYRTKLIAAAISAIVCFLVGICAGGAVFGDPPPAVIIDVEASAQLAIEAEAPVLPDDFAKNDPPRISANWLEDIPPAVIKDDPAAGKEGEVFPTLFTSDGTWKCKACDVQSGFLSSVKPKFTFQTVAVPAQGPSPNNKVPVWRAPDGTIFEGAMETAKLEQWVKTHSPKKETVQAAEGKAEVEQPKALSVVEIEASSSSAVIAALVDHIARDRLVDKGGLAPAGSVNVRSWLPEIDVDVSDPLLAVLDSLMKKEGYTLGGLRVAWPAGKRAVIFDPPVDVAYRKILEVSSKVKSVEINGREVVVRLEGRLINDLKVRLK